LEDNIWIGGRSFVTQVLTPVFEFLNTSNGTPFNNCYSLTIDKLDNIWVCSERVFTGEFTGIQAI